MKLRRTVSLLVKIGLIRVNDEGQIRWPISFAPKWVWKGGLKTIWTHAKFFGFSGGGKTFLGFYVFHNLPGVIKWEKNRLLPRRWGGGFCGLIEIGDRG